MWGQCEEAVNNVLHKQEEVQKHRFKIVLGVISEGSGGRSAVFSSYGLWRRARAQNVPPRVGYF